MVLFNNTSIIVFPGCIKVSMILPTGRLPCPWNQVQFLSIRSSNPPPLYISGEGVHIVPPLRRKCCHYEKRQPGGRLVGANELYEVE